MKWLTRVICRIGFHRIGKPHVEMSDGGYRYHCEWCWRILTVEADGSCIMSDCFMWDGEKEIPAPSL